MKSFLKAFFSDSNTVNEKTVIGVIFTIAVLVAGFVPGVGTFAFWGFLGAALGSFAIDVPEGLAKIKAS